MFLFQSLDDIWYFGGQDEHRQVSILDHSPQGRDEIEILKGDNFYLLIDGNTFYCTFIGAMTPLKKI